MNLHYEIVKFKDELNQHRKRIRRFDPESVVIACSDHFRWVDTDIERMRRFPHSELYQLLKISIKESERPYTPYIVITEKDFNKLIQEQENLNGPQFKIAQAEGDPLVIGFKWLGQFCQFPYQDKIDRTAIARSIFLYEEENCKLDIKNLFEIKTGVSLRSFFQGCFGQWVVVDGNLFVENRISGSTLQVFSSPIWNKFLLLVRVDFAGFRNLCNETDLRSELYEMFSAPVLLRAPIIQLPSGKNIVPWPMFLLQRLCFGPYDILKDSMGSEFTDSFGIAFQNYISRILEVLKKRIGQEYFKEKDATQQGKVPDFFIVDESSGALLCIEVKANEDKLVLSESTLINTARPILGKAVCQCYDLWRRACEGKEKNIPKNLGLCIPLIVTFRSFFFANVEFYRKNVVLSECKDREKETFQICVDNYQVLDVRCFEILAKVSLSLNRSLLSIVQEKIKSVREDEWSSFLNEKVQESQTEGVWKDNLDGITDECDALFDELQKSIS
jgi:hypothetical protein